MVPGRRLFVACYAASGAAALVYEVTWIRLFSLQLGHSVAAASTVLAAFMGGLAIGAWVAGTASGTGPLRCTGTRGSRSGSRCARCSSPPSCTR